MLQLVDIRKAYTTAAFTQVALDNVSVSFRDNEFAAILGPSGSGKTTMLNILGGLDHADSGDIIINGVSTKDYSDKDWDAYRNHRIGFIFQSYNLIPHQSVLSNVELALTLAGDSSAKRRERALAALDRVGLAEHANKRPSQLSGGQMQRVAIARALVNDPDIVLADEPTGALDTETGLQVMELLKEIARDRLVVMVTHNPELAEQYATRIIRLRDGRIVDDTNPLRPDELAAPQATKDQSDATRHASMSFLTALSLSFNNLMTKKGRTFMTAFAGSIGIIGIAAILALSNGVNAYIARTEQEALSSYPLTITKSSFDVTNLMMASMGVDGNDDEGDQKESKSKLIPQSTIMGDMFAKVKNNDLRAFKKFLESGESGIEPYVSSVQYSYGINPYVYKANTKKGVVKLNPSRMGSTLTNGLAGSAFLGGSSMSSFTELLDDQSLVEQSLELLEGRWPKAYDECVFVLNRKGSVTDYTLYSLGVYDIKVMDDMVTKALAGEEVEVPDTHVDFTRDDAMKLHFWVIPASSMYQKNEEKGTWADMSGDSSFMREALKKGVDLHVVGVVQQSDNASSSGIPEGIAYTPALTLHLMKEAQDSRIVSEQRANKDVDVFTGKTFEELADEESRKFDMESAFTVDEEALKKAFSFDSSVLENLGSNMDMDLSDVDFNSLADGMDLSSIQLDESQISSVFSEDTMANIMAGAPAFTMEDVALPAEQSDAMQKVGSELAADFMSWMMTSGKYPTEDTDYATLMQEYMQTESAQRIVAELYADEAFSPDSDVMGQLVSTAMSNYMQQKLGPYLSEQLGQLMVTAGNAIAEQLTTQLTARITEAMGGFGTQLSETIASQLSGKMSQLSDVMQDGFSFDADAFSRAIKFNMSQEDLASLLSNYMNADELTYEGNLIKLGYASEDSPESVSIYPLDFPSKEAVLDIVDNYNKRMEDEGKEDSAIQYSDLVGTLMGSVTDIVNTISLVLIAFVSISLVVSSIMISIITYISVLERKKEIGILRAMGASKLNVANIFNAETVIEGFFAGVLAVAVVYLASGPVNAIIYKLKDVPDIMQLPIENALVLVAISVVLTLVAGLIPSSAAARRDPVEALRSE
ncbi:MAG: ABC transporter ATP-binding protein/permease [Atopobiaceae bacterium]|nr:ABC transporter ATP-binding protein/permease [Atopobiaceae bacterium]